MANIIRLGGGAGGGGGSVIEPIFKETKIAEDTTPSYSFTFTHDYHDFDFVKFKVITTWGGTLMPYENWFITTPSIIDHIISLGSGINFNLFDTNIYCYYTESGSTWTRDGYRDLYIAEVYGVDCLNATVTEVDIYKASARSSSDITVTSQTLLDEYDVILFAANSSSYDELQPCWFSASYKELGKQYKSVQKEFDIYRTKDYTSVLDDSYVESDFRFNHYNSRSNITISNNGLTAERYLYVLGIKFEGISGDVSFSEKLIDWTKLSEVGSFPSIPLPANYTDYDHLVMFGVQESADQDFHEGMLQAYAEQYVRTGITIDPVLVIDTSSISASDTSINIPLLSANTFKRDTYCQTNINSSRIQGYNYSWAWQNLYLLVLGFND